MNRECILRGNTIFTELLHCMKSNIEIKEMPAMHLAALTVTGEGNMPSAFDKLIQWAAPKGLMHAGTRMATIYHDSHRNTAPDMIKISVAIILDEPIPADTVIEAMTMPSGNYIQGSYRLGFDEFGKTWTDLFQWMLTNGYKKDTGAPFEIYYNNPHEDPEKKANVEFYIPIV